MLFRYLNNIKLLRICWIVILENASTFSNIKNFFIKRVFLSVRKIKNHFLKLLWNKLLYSEAIVFPCLTVD